MASETPAQSQPDTSGFLFVSPEVKGEQKAMRVYRMSEEDILALSKGYKVNLHVEGSGEHAPRLLKPKLTLRALCAFIPAIARAVRSHKSNNGAFITDVVLPNHLVSAYNKLFGWIWASILAGHVLRPVRVDRSALRMYQEVKTVAEKLSIGYMVKAMDARITQMAAAAPKAA
ncbi:hypothetical protein LTR64_001377 [Lithohypha guttulata]|uniref:uncharacterized protein n=1 Tax=Lithohypha guttulata TaxID=1690604 RepID=UPI002DE18E94|nr:hypothetical protein LTR51_003571 [Lithohypha guttulata]